MAQLSLTFACGRYDRTEPLRTGDVKVEGIDLNFIPIDEPRIIFDRLARGEFDVSELSASEFISMTGRGNCPFVALPVFPSRVFRHGFIFDQHAARVFARRKISKASASACRSTPKPRPSGFAVCWPTSMV